MSVFQNYKKLITGIIVLTIAILNTSCESKTKMIKINNKEVKAELIFEENFDAGLKHWVVEQMPKGTVEVNNSKLEINDVSGCTVWFKKALEGSILIEYDALLIKENGPNDRVSDLNCFWMASDPENPKDLFENSDKRGGKFSNYDSLKLYYMGVGGNDNKTTRFRRYVGNGERPLLPEHDLSAEKFMSEPNTLYHIKIIAKGGTIQYYRNDVLLVDFQDSKPYTSGYFGLRTVKNHMTIDNFKVYQLQDE